MKVKDVAHGTGIWVEDSLPIKNLARLVFTANLSGFPVVHKEKLVGFITEEDIFSNIYDLKGEEIVDSKKVAALLEEPVSTIMVKNPMFVTPETSLVEAQILMYKNNFTRLPVVDHNKKILGTIARGDVFRHILKHEIPTLEKGQYASFMSENYDQMIDWDMRVENEFPTLFRVFQKHNVKSVVDVGSWTGEYAIRLAKEGVETVGLDHNPLMVAYANGKKSKLPQSVKNKVSFQLTDFSNLTKIFEKNSVEAVLSVGTSLAYVPQSPKKILNDLYAITKKGGVIVIQILNLEKVVEEKGRFLNFRVKKNPKKQGEELFIEYFDKKDENTLIHNIVNFTSNGDRWVFAGINSIEISYLKNNDVIKMLEDAGYKDINVTGTKGEFRGQFGQMSLIKPFDPRTSDWMTVIAVKK